MTKDTVIVGLLIVAFAFAVTVHTAIVFGLAKRKPRWRAPIALVIVVLAPYWAWRGQMRTRAVLWLGGVVLYAIMLALAWT